MFDLHTHSLHSDGILRPQELVSRAKQHGVTTLALTDHDTLAGLDAAGAAAAACSMAFVSGVEISCQWRGLGIHVVGLNFDPAHEGLCAALAEQQQLRDRRGLMIAERLVRAGLPDTLEGARRHAGEGALGRPHFAKYLVECGAVSSMDQAFKRYLGAGKPGDVKQLWPTIDRAVEWIVAAGGVAVLAHPDKYRMTRTKLRALLTEFSSAGGRAMEVVSGSQTPVLTAELARLANAMGLYASRGSDFHDPALGWQDVGCGDRLPDNCRPVWDLFA